jgi:hypothetical protein
MAESEFADHQTSRTAPGTSATEWTLSTVRCSAGEARRRAVFVDGGRPDGERRRLVPTYLNDASSDFCDPFGFCQDWLHQLELTAGVDVRFDRTRTAPLSMPFQDQGFAAMRYNRRAVAR